MPTADARLRLRFLGTVLAAGLGAAFAAGFLVEVWEVLRNGYFGQGLYYLPWFGIRERAADLWPAAVLFAGATAASAAIWVRLRDGPAWIAAALPPAAVLGLLAALTLEPPLGVLADPRGGAVRSLLWQGRLALKAQPLAAWLLALGLAAGLVLVLSRAGGQRGRARSWAALGLAAACLAGIFAATEARRRTAGRDPARRNVLLVVLDTAAAGHMASYGYRRSTTPEIDRLAREGAMFRNSWSASPWTLPSHASMLTGLYPIAHGATQEKLTLGHRFVTAAELLKDRGYRTFAAVNNGVISAASGLDQGFSTYLEMKRRDQVRTYCGRGRHPTNAAVEEFLRSLAGVERFFAFLNYIEPHAPYRPPPSAARRYLPEGWDAARAREVPQGWSRYYMGEIDPSPEEFGILNDLYDAELADLDAAIGDLMALLEGRGLLEETLVILTSDHGENLGDHGHLDHVFTIYETVLRVPLVLLGAGVPRGVGRTDPASSADLFYTILGAAGLQIDGRPPQGRDLLAGDPPAEAAVLAEYYYPLQVLSVLAERRRGYEAEFPRLAPYLRRLRSIQVGGWKLIWGSDGRHALYHLAEDPGEERDLAAAEPERVRRLERLLFERLSALKGERIRPGSEPLPGPEAARGFRGVDRETLEQLRALGYVGGER